MAYRVENLDHRSPHVEPWVRCMCGGITYTTPEPPSDPFYSGRFACIACGAVWSTDNIVQRLAFVEVV